MLKLIPLIPLLLISLLTEISNAETIEGRVKLSIYPMLLIESNRGIEIFAVQDSAKYRNMRHLGEAMPGSMVRIRYNEEIAKVKITDDIELLPNVRSRFSFEDIHEFTSFIKDADKNRYLLIDPRDKDEWDKGHMLGSISIPFNEMKEEALPDNREKILIFVSDGPQHSLAHEAAQKAMKMGYKNVRVFNEGISGLRSIGEFTAVSVDYLKKIMKDNAPFVLVDTRQRSRATEGHIPGAISIPADIFKLEDILVHGRHDDYPVIFYGEDENDASPLDAAKKAVGYPGIVSLLEGGFKKWNMDNRPVERGHMKTQRIYSPAQSSGEISYEEFKDLWNKRDGSVFILNVKSRNERYHFDWEKNIPYNELHLRIDEIPNDKEVVVYCSVGMRSAIAYQVLKKNGFRVRFLNRQVDMRPDGTLLD